MTTTELGTSILRVLSDGGPMSCAAALDRVRKEREVRWAEFTDAVDHLRRTGHVFESTSVLRLTATGRYAVKESSRG